MSVMPGLQVDAAGALAPTALVHRGDGGVERLQQRDDAVRLAVGPPDERARERTGDQARPIPPANFESRATWL